MDQDEFDDDYDRFSQVDAMKSPAEIKAWLADPDNLPKARSKDEVKESKKNNPPIENLTSDNPSTEPEDQTPPVQQ